MKNGIDHEKDYCELALKLTKYVVMHKKPEFKLLHDGYDPNADTSILIKPPAWPHHKFSLKKTSFVSLMKAIWKILMTFTSD